MKTLSISAVVVASFLLAVGSGLLGRTSDETAKSESCCLAKPAPVVAATTEGSCCSSTKHAIVSTEAADKSACGSCCGDKSQQVLATTEAAPAEKSCGTGACCGSKATTVLATTEATDTKECAAGTCCSSKNVTVSTPAEKACDGKECKPTGECCEARKATVLTTTEASDKKECAGGTCCSSKNVTVSTPAEEACDGKECKPTGECCEARQAAVLTTTEASDKKECAAGTCCASKPTTVLASTEVADDKKCEEGTCPAGQCPVSSALAKLPKMTYSVGTEQVCCGEKAQALAAEHKAPMLYVVAEKTYECKTAAMTALVEETENFVAAFTAPKKCEASGNVSLAGKAIACPVEAEKQVTLVTTAVEKIEMQYEVAGEKAACIVCATNKAKEKSASVEYVVGDQKTTCELSARLNLAVAKYKAAVQATMAPAVATEANAG